MKHPLNTLDGMIVHAAETEITTWQEHSALKVVNGLVVLEDFVLSEGRIEVTLGTDGAAYSGIAFHIKDRANYELGYVQPHTSGQWDAIQYDPVFHGANTWQVYHGEAYQKTAIIPTGEWFTLCVDVKDNQVAFTVGNQPPLVVSQLMQPIKVGRIGLWSYLPAYFRDLRVSDCQTIPESVAKQPQQPDGIVDEWFIDGFGGVACEPHGVLNLNRYFPMSMEKVLLTRQFNLSSESEVVFSFGFSDELTLQLNGETVFEGKNIFINLENYENRGYIRPDQHTLSRTLAPGIHTLTAQVKATEPVGWGLSMLIHSDQIKLLPVI